MPEEGDDVDIENGYVCSCPSHWMKACLCLQYSNILCKRAAHLMLSRGKAVFTVPKINVTYTNVHF